MLAAPLVLLVVALIFMVLSAMGKAPLWPSVFCLILLHLLGMR